MTSGILKTSAPTVFDERMKLSDLYHEVAGANQELILMAVEKEEISGGTPA
jgi:hypothetical protein